MENQKTKRKNLARQESNSTNWVRTIAVLSPVNPVGKELSEAECQELKTVFEQNLKIGHFPYFKSADGFYTVYNIGFDVAKKDAMDYSADSFIFVRIHWNKEGDAVFTLEYWKHFCKTINGKEQITTYKIKGSQVLGGSFESVQAKNDFLARLNPPFKSFIPNDLAEQMAAVNNAVESYAQRHPDEDILQVFSESFSEEYTGFKNWITRNKIYGKWDELKLATNAKGTSYETWTAEHDIAILAANRVAYTNATCYTLEALNEVWNPDGHIYSKDENVHRGSSLWAALIVAKFGVSRLKAAFGMGETAPENTENVFVVINRLDDAKFFDKCFELAEYYNQDCFFFKAKDGEKPSDAICVGTNLSDKLGYNIKISCGEFGAQAVNDYLRRISDSSFGGELPEIDKNSLFSDGYVTEGDYVRLHGVIGSMAMHAQGANIWSNIYETKHINPDIQVVVCEGRFRNILSFAVLAEQNSDTAGTHSKGEKTHKSLLDHIESYVSVPAEGRVGSYTGNLLIVINILFDNVKKIAEKCGLPAFCFVDAKKGVIEYWATENEDKPYNWFSNDYVKKNEITDFQFPDGLAADYAVEGGGYKFTLPTEALADVSAKIQANVDKYFNGNSAIVDWCMNHVGYEKYLRWERLYKFE